VVVIRWQDQLSLGRVKYRFVAHPAFFLRHCSYVPESVKQIFEDKWHEEQQWTRDRGNHGKGWANLVVIRVRVLGATDFAVTVSVWQKRFCAFLLPIFFCGFIIEDKSQEIPIPRAKRPVFSPNPTHDIMPSRVNRNV
jgi:hypothetical protein